MPRLPADRPRTADRLRGLDDLVAPGGRRAWSIGDLSTGPGPRGSTPRRDDPGRPRFGSHGPGPILVDPRWPTSGRRSGALVIAASPSPIRVPPHPSPARLRRTESMPVVRIPTPLRPHAGGLDSVEADGSTVGEVLGQVFEAHPGAQGADLRRHRAAPVRQCLRQQRRHPLPRRPRHQGRAQGRGQHHPRRRRGLTGRTGDDAIEGSDVMATENGRRCRPTPWTATAARSASPRWASRASAS